MHYLSIYTNKPSYPTCLLLRFEWDLKCTTCFKFLTQHNNCLWQRKMNFKKYIYFPQEEDKWYVFFFSLKKWHSSFFFRTKNYFLKKFKDDKPLKKKEKLIWRCKMGLSDNRKVAGLFLLRGRANWFTITILSLRSPSSSSSPSSFLPLRVGKGV